ncbi:MAG TPA: DHA2 family efflux MFS transporter permease subunit [Solirubrobacteraceae bacterium]|nr:DHA2 family efflux MFS transporter permease subunit [Solirubrobacteraceae bacterium]
MSSPRAVLAVAVLGTFMAFVDATIVNIAVPNIHHDFARSQLSSVSWVLNAYNIVFAAFLVGGGQLADLLGRRKVFSFALVAFTLGSTLCAIAPSLGLLVAARMLQAAGSAMLVPSSLAIVLEAHAERERMHAVALWSAVAALAAGIGPPLGGLLITASNWRLVFLVNIPVGAVALVLAQRVLVESRAPGRRRVPDLLGGAVLALAIAALVLAVVKGQEWGWGGARVIGAFAIALLLSVCFLLRTSRQRAPVLDLSLLRIRSFAISNGVTVVMAGGFYAYTLCNVLFLTTVWRYSILTAGLALTPGPLTAMAVAGPASRVVERLGHRAVAAPGALVWAGGMAFFAATLRTRADFLSGWLPGMLILGLGAGLTFPTLSGAAVASVPGPRFAIATSLNSVARQLGAALGVAVLIAILGTPTPLHALHAFQHGWLFAGGCFLAGSLACLALVVSRSEDLATGSASAGAGADDRSDGRSWVRAIGDVGATGEEPAGAPRGAGSSATRLPSLAKAAGERAQVTPQTVAQFLRNVPLFAALSDELRQEIATLARSVSLAPQQWLFRQGDAADALYIVRIGHLEVVKEDQPDSPPVTINTLTRGAVLGELALLSHSARSASVRALRDSELLRIDRAGFDSLLRREPQLALSLTRVLSAQLQASRAVPVARRPRPVTIALRAADPHVPVLDIADELSRAMCDWGSVAVLYPDPQRNALRDPGLDDAAARADAIAHYGPLVERLELDHDQLIMVCGTDQRPSAWDRFCTARADRVLVVVSPHERIPGDPEGNENGGEAGAPDREDGDASTWTSGLHGADLVGYDIQPASARLSPWIQRLQPAGVFSLSAGAQRRHDCARIARRLAGRSVGVVLAGGGARAFAHLGALDVLLDAGLTVDRVAGVSMGAFIGGLLATGRDSAAIDACCYEEWVRRNPINDYTLPRHALIKGHKAEVMLERVFGDVCVEELARSFYCSSVNLRGSQLVIHRHGLLTDAIGASISLPLIGPPLRHDGALLVDGSLLDNLPLAPMSSSGEGPVLAIDIKGGDERLPAAGGAGAASPGSDQRASRPPRLPSLPETMARIALLSSANTDESARRYADMTIPVRVPGVGLLEFHQIDAAREAGRVAAAAALDDAPGWLLPGGGEESGVGGRRTVVRV